MRRVLLAFTLAPFLCFAQKPDLSGTWTLNKAKSNFGTQPADQIPDATTLTLVSSDTDLKIKTVAQVGGQEVTTEDAFKLDGSPIVISDLKTTAKWEGDTVVISGIGKFKGKTLRMDQRYTLSADRKTLTQDLKVDAPPVAQVTMKLVYENAPKVVDFSGTWKFNPAKSNFGTLPEEYRPTAITRVMTQTPEVLGLETEQTTAQGSLKTAFKLKLDGTESINSVQGVEIKSLSRINGPTLELVYKRPLGELTLEILEKDYLAEDGRSLIVETQIGGTPAGVITTRYVFEKQ